MKDKLAPDLSDSATVHDSQGDIVQALLALGYNEREANSALKSLPPEVAVAEGIKLALRALSR